MWVQYQSISFIEVPFNILLYSIEEWRFWVMNEMKVPLSFQYSRRCEYDDNVERLLVFYYATGNIIIKIYEFKGYY